MSEPTFDALHTGNNEDDDAAVIDSFFIEVDNAPGLVPQDLVTVAKETWPTVTKLLTTTYVVAPSWAPVLLFPKDPNRVGLDIKVISVTGTDQLWVSDDTGKIGNASTAFVMNSTALSHSLDDHTGPVYITPNPANAGSITVTAMAVTK